MTSASCATEPRELLEYWLGELDEARQRAIDEHLFACAACSDRLGSIVELGRAIRRELLEGHCTFVTSAPFIRRIKEAGLRVREYTLPAGGSVDCTVTPEDDFVVSYLRAPLKGVRRLDLVIDDSTSGRHRQSDVAFDPEAEGLVAVTSTTYLKALKDSRLRVRLLAVDGVEERVVADYTFNHSPS